MFQEFGIEIRDPALRAEVAFALGAEVAGDRMRDIFRSAAAQTRPSDALRLALESSLGAEEVVRILEALPPELPSVPASDATVVA